MCRKHSIKSGSFDSFIIIIIIIIIIITVPSRLMLYRY